MDSSGNIYGTFQAGGSGGDGFLYQLTPTNSINVLYSFSTSSPSNGYGPFDGLIMDASGNLYGTTSGGGTNSIDPKLFKIASTGGPITILHNFGSIANDGLTPFGSLIMDTSGNLYGVTTSGGTITNDGIIYKITSTGLYSIIYNFLGSPTNKNESAGVTIDSTGNYLYGTTLQGGTGSKGTIFKIPIIGGSDTILHNFTGHPDGAFPQGSLTMDSSGTFYGTTQNGDINTYGTIFSISSSGAYNVLHSFNGTDGSQPGYNLLLNNGYLYGVTNLGGLYDKGTIYKFNINTGQLTTLVMVDNV